VKFYVGLHQPHDARHFERACISINRLRGRRSPVECPEVLVDSGAFTELATHGGYRHEVEEYAAELRRLHWHGVVKIVAAVAQDFMCEAFMLERTGMTIPDHQRLTIERYDALVAALPGVPFPVLPVLQGYAPTDYARHVEAYGDRLKPDMWVGVGSVCKRNGDPERIVEVLWEIRRLRPDLRLHGFGVKRTALLHAGVRDMLATADSMAWSHAERRMKTGLQNDWHRAAAFHDHVLDAALRAPEPWQMPLL